MGYEQQLAIDCAAIAAAGSRKGTSTADVVEFAFVGMALSMMKFFFLIRLSQFWMKLLY
jgi:hypothetical protein